MNERKPAAVAVTFFDFSSTTLLDSNWCNDIPMNTVSIETLQAKNEKAQKLGKKSYWELALKVIHCFWYRSPSLFSTPSPKSFVWGTCQQQSTRHEPAWRDESKPCLNYQDGLSTQSMYCRNGKLARWHLNSESSSSTILAKVGKNDKEIVVI